MTARILDGKTTSAQIRSEVAERVQALSDKGIIPGLAAVLVGDDAASRIYVGQKHKASADVGIRSEQVDLPAYVTEHELLATIRRLNRDPELTGVGVASDDGVGHAGWSSAWVRSHREVPPADGSQGRRTDGVAALRRGPRTKRAVAGVGANATWICDSGH